MSNPYSAATSYLLSRGWAEYAITDRASSWTKRDALAVATFTMAPGSLSWRQFLLGVAHIEKTTPTELERAILEPASLVALPLPSSDRVELDLHLTGPGVRGHETEARRFGLFVSATADAVNELIKDSAHLERHPSRLQVVGGPVEGSVRVQFREPEPLADEPLFDMPGATPEGKAMHRLAQIFNSADQAADRPIDSILDAQVSLDPGARRALARVARLMGHGGWNAHGFLTRPEGEPLAVGLSMAGAHRLQLATEEAEEKVQTRTYHGLMDSWTWSLGEMRLTTDEGRSVRAAVPALLQLRVAALNSEPDQRVTATFQVIERIGPKGNREAAQHALVSITAELRLVEVDQGPDIERVALEDRAQLELPPGPEPDSPS